MMAKPSKIKSRVATKKREQKFCVFEKKGSFI